MQSDLRDLRLVELLNAVAHDDRLPALRLPCVSLLGHGEFGQQAALLGLQPPRVAATSTARATEAPQASDALRPSVGVIENGAHAVATGEPVLTKVEPEALYDVQPDYSLDQMPPESGHGAHGVASASGVAQHPDGAASGML